MEKEQEPHTIIAGVQVPDDVIPLLRQQMARGGFMTVGEYLTHVVREADKRQEEDPPTQSTSTTPTC